MKVGTLLLIRHLSRPLGLGLSLVDGRGIIITIYNGWNNVPGNETGFLPGDQLLSAPEEWK